MATSNRTAGKVRSHLRSGSSRLPNTSSATNRKAQIRRGGTTARAVALYARENASGLTKNISRKGPRNCRSVGFAPTARRGRRDDKKGRAATHEERLPDRNLFYRL